LLQVFDKGGDVEGLHLDELGDVVRLAPGRKPARGIEVRLAGVALFTWPVKNSITRLAAFGVGAKSAAVKLPGTGDRIKPLLIGRGFLRPAPLS